MRLDGIGTDPLPSAELLGERFRFERTEQKARNLRRGVHLAAGSKTKEEIVWLNIINDYEFGQELLCFIHYPTALGADS
jgi:hypothetical protein